ncbi:5'-nucleotidase [Noviherbaspirillum pedocola]|nr:5'-nucleotidase [Noviherbaspirillum pedocola]
MKEMESCEKLVIAVASSALFDLRESHRVFETEGEDAYARHQRAHEAEAFAPGPAFHLVRKLLALNDARPAQVEVILLSRNSADTSLRIFHSLRHHALGISRAAFTRGAPPYRYAAAFGAHLFLSTDPGDVRMALHAGIAAATVLGPLLGLSADEIVRIAFDGDAVLFSDEAERVFAESGLDAFTRSEIAARHIPLPGGPFQPFLARLHRIQAQYSAHACPIRTALVTARCAPAHERVVRTLRFWDIRIDEALFLGGMDKGPFLKSFGADIFFDDQQRNCDAAAGYVQAAHVPYGVKNAAAANA